MPEKNNPNLLRRWGRRGLWGLLIISALIFVPAGSLRFWQGWALLAVQFGAGTGFSFYFYNRDPQVLERRLLRKETLTEQKLIIILWKALGGTSLVVSGLDHRHGWSGTFLDPVPVWLEVLSLLFILGAYALHFQVLKANPFAASVIQIEAGQSVSATGLYGRIRHPMYLGFAVMGVFTPLALGSFVGFAISLLIIPTIVFRLLNEERFLRRDLAGYTEYCRRTPYRLIPLVW
jgi:protein-S-isoprenylcysteine O-methyltransferase Ste14